MSNNNDDNISTILMVIGLLTVLYWLLKFFQTDFGGNLLLFIIFMPLFISSICGLFFEKETSLINRWPDLIMAIVLGTVGYLLFFG